MIINSLAPIREGGRQKYIFYHSLHGVNQPFGLNFEYNDRKNKTIPNEVQAGLNFEYNDRRNKIIPKAGLN